VLWYVCLNSCKWPAVKVSVYFNTDLFGLTFSLPKSPISDC
jgi:hypothetical protein